MFSAANQVSIEEFKQRDYTSTKTLYVTRNVNFFFLNYDDLEWIFSLAKRLALYISNRYF